MLKLSLRLGESIKIGDDVKVTVMMSNYNRIQLQVDAPKEINISREKREQQEKAQIVMAGKERA